MLNLVGSVSTVFHESVKSLPLVTVELAAGLEKSMAATRGAARAARARMRTMVTMDGGTERRRMGRRSDCCQGRLWLKGWVKGRQEELGWLTRRAAPTLILVQEQPQPTISRTADPIDVDQITLDHGPRLPD